MDREVAATGSGPAMGHRNAAHATGISSQFKIAKSFKERQADAADCRTKFPAHIPIICEQATHRSSSGLPDLTKRKFLVPEYLTVAQFYAVLRQRLSISSTHSLYLHCCGFLLSNTSSLSRVDSDFRDVDGFLYITYAGQEAFG